MEEIVKLIVVVGVVLVSMILHELAHGVMAYWLGDETAKDMGRLSFNPLKHLDPYMSILVPVMLYLIGGPIFGGAKPVPINPRNLKFREWGMALVAVAGPAMNFILAFGVFLIGHFTGWLYEDSLMGFGFYRMMFANLGFMIFNLIPIPPLDGSRILYAIAPDGARRVIAGMENYGIIIVMIMVVGFSGVLSQVMVRGMLAVLQFFQWVVGA